MCEHIGMYDWMTKPKGLCANREQHSPHLVETGSLAPFICTATQEDREPGRSQRRQDQRRSESLSEG